MTDHDDFDDYAGEYDHLAAEVTAERAASAKAAMLPQTGIDLDQHGRWTGKGPAPVRPWWCASCHATAFTESEKQYGLCSGCASSERAIRERMRAQRTEGQDARDVRAVRGRRAV